MRTALATVLACLVVGMTSADQVSCPDGCTDEAPTEAASQHATSPCAFCHGWSHSPVVVTSRPAPRVLARLPLVTPHRATPALPTIELPPKNA